MFFLSIILLMFVVLLNRIIYKDHLKTNFVYTFIWLLVINVAYYNLLDLYAISFNTILYSFLTVICFNVGYFTFFTKKKPREVSYGEFCMKERLEVRYKAIIIINLVLLIVVLPMLYRSIMYTVQYGWDALRAVSYGKGDFLGSQVYLRIYAWIITPVFVVISLFSVYFLFYSKNRRSLYNRSVIFLGIVDTIVLTLNYGGRINIFRYLILIIIMFFVLKKQYKNHISINSKIVNTIIFSIVLLMGLTFLRSFSNLSFIKNILIYFFGPINYFDVLINDIGVTTSYLYGKGMLGFLLNPVSYGYNYLLGNENTTSEYLIKLVTDNYYYIGANVRYNAFPTHLYAFYRDAGSVGVVIGSLFMGGLSKAVEISFKTKKTKLSFFIYSMVLYFIFTSILSYWFLTIQTFFIFAFIIFFIKTEPKVSYEKKF